MKKLLTTALLLATMVGSAAPAAAITPEQAAQHNQLIKALEARGVAVTFDSPRCRALEDLSGYYMSTARSITLCTGGSTAMTEDNMDTLRHESIHVVQDCKGGGIGNRNLQPVFKPSAVLEMVKNSTLDVDRMIEVYTSKGASKHVLNLELEAFSGASQLRADAIAYGVLSTCKAPAAQ